jgi:2-haloacid dehalogenase
MAIRALVFDAYGTLYDVHSVRSLAIDLCGDKGELVIHLWRLKQLEYTWLRSLMRSYQDFWLVTQESLEFALKSVGIEPAPSLCNRLMSGYLHLDLYEEAEQALGSLRGYNLAILSNGSPSMLETLVSSSKIAGCFKQVISVDQVKLYKPEPACYALVEPALGVAKEEVLFVSSNGFDVSGAKRYGFRVAWIDRAADVQPRGHPAIEPAEFYRLIRGRAEQLNYDADFRVSRLTDLVPLVNGWRVRLSASPGRQ